MFATSASTSRKLKNKDEEMRKLLFESMHREKELKRLLNAEELKNDQLKIQFEMLKKENQQEKSTEIF